MFKCCNVADIQNCDPFSHKLPFMSFINFEQNLFFNLYSISCFPIYENYVTVDATGFLEMLDTFSAFPGN